MSKYDIAISLLEQSSSDYTNAMECKTMREGAQEIFKLREQLEKAVSLGLCIENTLGSLLSNNNYVTYYQDARSIHQKFRAFVKEVKYV